MVTKDFAELFSCCNARGVRAVVVGGYALAFHAKPRFTKRASGRPQDLADLETLG